MDKTQKKEYRKKLIDDLAPKIAEREARILNTKERQRLELEAEQLELDVLKLQVEALTNLK